MYRRRLVTAIIMSLVFHGVLLAVFEIDNGTPAIEINSLITLPVPTSTTVRLSPPSARKNVEIDPPAAASEPKKTQPVQPAPAVPKPPEGEAVESEPVDMGAANVVQPAADRISTDTDRFSETTDSAIGVATLSTTASVSPADTGPSLLTALDPEYPIMARRMGVEGVVILNVTVDRRGYPVDYHILSPRSHRVLEESALAAVMNARFRPGTRGGKPTIETFRLKVRFELDSRGT